MPSETVGTLIRLARQARGWSITEAAEAADMSFQNWGRIERGEAKTVPPGTLAHMAVALGLLPEELTEIGEDEAAAVLAFILKRKARVAKEQPQRPKNLEELTAAVEHLQRRFDELMEDRKQNDR